MVVDRSLPNATRRLLRGYLYPFRISFALSTCPNMNEFVMSSRNRIFVTLSLTCFDGEGSDPPDDI
jgi:hypothetical protein